MRLREVLCPVTNGGIREEGIHKKQYREFNKFLLSELSRSGAAFLNTILEQNIYRAELVKKTVDTNGT